MKYRYLRIAQAASLMLLTSIQQATPASFTWTNGGANMIWNDTGGTSRVDGNSAAGHTH